MGHHVGVIQNNGVWSTEPDHLAKTCGTDVAMVQFLQV